MTQHQVATGSESLGKHVDHAGEGWLGKINEHVAAEDGVVNTPAKRPLGRHQVGFVEANPPAISFLELKPVGNRREVAPAALRVTGSKRALVVYGGAPLCDLLGVDIVSIDLPHDARSLQPGVLQRDDQ